MLKLWTVFSKMGIIFSRFKKKSPAELLDEVAEEIEELKACSVDTELRHKKIIRQLMIYSSGICVLFAILLYFYIPQILKTKIILYSLLLLSPILYYIVSKTVSWYYKRKIKSSHARLKTLKQEKKRLIDEIMNKETYKVAKDILEKYAPEALPKKEAPIVPMDPQSFNSRMSMVPNKFPPMLPPIMNKPNYNEMAAMHMRMIGQKPPGSAAATANQPLRAVIAPEQVRGVPPRLPQSKSYFERFFEYLINDGPNSRYALICKNCFTHNGMTLTEEFEYTAFKCYACHTFNPARKQRPAAPRLESDSFFADNPSNEGTSSFPETSDTGNLEIEEVEDGKEFPVEDSKSRITVNEVNEALEMRETTGGTDNSSSLPSVEDGNSSGKTSQLGGSESSTEESKTEIENKSRPWKSAEVLNYAESKLEDSDNKKIKSESVLNGASDN